ncbi:MAG: uroporphyrinogen decarboxylase family protein [Deltaproteobacteria bacterium]|nr:uroporphyrinogen decarboxylase family protein [Deltaproteobacteria bacterium]MBW2051761.1 uroporphyrinogen decarboxylase family protein [Deltaproteobacteria bacterium]MBW2140383.1 uroporphyrinogen decarboxylase family protein [Deltaproteobacteria bacterium]MBW2322369.1 uroporphyrinogen decarboxylase family protein [Deltaproteobacteria bacterium]
MQELTGRQYMISALKRRHADRLPTTVLVGPYCSRLTDYSIKEILNDAKKSAEAHLAFYDRFRPDSLIVYNDIFLEAEAIGCEMEFPEDNISHPKAPILEDASRLAGLKVPDPKKDGRIPYFFELCERVFSEVSKTATMGLGHSGPWNIAIQTRGAEQLLMDTILDPEFVHELMKFTTEVVRAMGDALIEAGFSPSLGEASASCSLISPKIYREFIGPYHKELQDYFMAKRAPMSLHVCGFIDPIMEDIIDTGINFISLDAPSSLKKLVDLSQGKVTIMGNVPTVHFATSSREEMESSINDCLETAAGGSGFILASGCEIPLNSTKDRIDHFFEYSRKSGRDFLSKLRETRPELFISSGEGG